MSPRPPNNKAKVDTNVDKSCEEPDGPDKVRKFL